MVRIPRDFLVWMLLVVLAVFLPLAHSCDETKTGTVPDNGTDDRHVAACPTPVLSIEQRPESASVETHLAVASKKGRTYRAFGFTQLYRSPDAVWLFVDIDTITERDPMASPPYSMRSEQFCVYMIGRKGLEKKLEVTQTPLSAHPNACLFFRQDSQLFGFLYRTRKVYQLDLSDKVPGRVMEADTSAALSDKVDKFAHVERSPEAINKMLGHEFGTGFSLVDAGMYGYGKHPPQDYEAQDLGVRIRFVKLFRGLGWQRVIAQGTVKEQEWENIVVDLPVSDQTKRP